ncbi:unnamed protein product [Onchocerca ochengi]|uniref:Transposase n=1 Tax=Onchocerca ochengi TaxID=42157 RepID=A0A182EDD7_ONCOC|nr:unnamed protein product [Onchocerca ochengi]
MPQQADDLITGQGVVSSRAASILRSVETYPLIGRFERFATDVGESVADGNSLVADELMVSTLVDIEPPLALLH